MGFENLAVLFLGTSFLCNLVIRDALKEILKLNVGRKKKYRETIKQQSILSKISLSYVRNYAKSHHKLCIILQFLNYIYLSLIMLFLLLTALYLLNLDVIKFTKSLVTIKVILIDIPISAFGFIKTGHDQVHGGVKWKL